MRGRGCLHSRVLRIHSKQGSHGLQWTRDWNLRGKTVVEPCDSIYVEFRGAETCIFYEKVSGHRAPLSGRISSCRLERGLPFIAGRDLDLELLLD